MRGHLVPDPELDARQQVLIDGVHSAGPQESDQVQRATPLPDAPAQLHQRRQGKELAPPDALGDANQILGDHAAGAQVQVPHLAVPHLSFGKTDGETAGVEQGARMTFPEAVPNRSAGQVRLRSLAPALAMPPPIEHHQDHRCRRRRSV